MDSLAEIRKQLAEICDKAANTRLSTLIHNCVVSQIEVDKWCRNRTFLLYTLPAITRVLYENEDMVMGVCDWLHAKAEEVAIINDVPFMNDKSDLDFLDRLVRLIGEKLRLIGPVFFAGLVYIGQSLVIFVCQDQ